MYVLSPSLPHHTGIPITLYLLTTDPSIVQVYIYIHMHMHICTLQYIVPTQPSLHTLHVCTYSTLLYLPRGSYPYLPDLNVPTYMYVEHSPVHKHLCAPPLPELFLLYSTLSKALNIHTQVEYTYPSSAWLLYICIAEGKARQREGGGERYNTYVSE